MSPQDQEYFVTMFSFIHARLTSIETQVTLLLNAEKKRFADANGITFDEAEAQINASAAKVSRGLQDLAEKLKRDLESQA